MKAEVRNDTHIESNDLVQYPSCSKTFYTSLDGRKHNLSSPLSLNGVGAMVLISWCWCHGVVCASVLVPVPC